MYRNGAETQATDPNERADWTARLGPVATREPSHERSLAGESCRPRTLDRPEKEVGKV